jgi:hypothetical protein
VHEPWSAHQIYKVYDEKYAEIFGRPEVTAERVIFITELTLVHVAAKTSASSGIQVGRLDHDQAHPVSEDALGVLEAENQ